MSLLQVDLERPIVEQVLGGGLKFALLMGVDPNPANYVAAGALATKSGTIQADDLSLLCRLEVSVQTKMCRVSVRACSVSISAAVSRIIATNLGAPA